ncbi:TIGR00153 family protein [Shewanella sp. TC10]|uniref:TIGR00153 family protein n=1 Tax=Shewanella sp. TC10 TaxID=1419739 RepID=UPI00129E5F07|nr:TIGR00153 family protein [Shewanella sp. TC10]
MPVNSILGVFAKSPLKPLEQHIDKVHECASLLVPFFEATTSGDWDEAVSVRKQISLLENDADALKREIRLTLPSGLFMPVERTDLLELLTQQDKIANKAKDISGRIIGRQLVFPQPVQAPFNAYLKRCLDAVSLAKQAINELDDLLETGFRGREVELVAKMINELDLIEADSDDLQIQVRRLLLSLEADLNPVDVMFMYKIIEWVGGLADLAERVGSRLELMLARSS